jgi:hypothetical protein
MQVKRFAILVLQYNFARVEQWKNKGFLNRDPTQGTQ